MKRINWSIAMIKEMAMAAAMDEANRNMRKAGRKVWNKEDYNIASETYNRLYPEKREKEGK